DGLARGDLLGPSPLDRVAEAEPGCATFGSACGVIHTADRQGAGVLERRPEGERTCPWTQTELRHDLERGVVQLLAARFDTVRPVRFHARADGRVHALTRERSEVREELPELVLPNARVGGIDDVPAGFGEPRSAAERIDDEDDLVVLDHPVTGLTRR